MLADRKSRHGLAFPVLDPTTCRVHVEKEIGSVRADILLDFSDALILIENKIYAEETPEQICRYARWLRVTQGARKTALLFLTLEGKEAISAGSEDYFRISYQRDIIPWLLACRNEVVSARVRDTLEQYVNAVDFLMGGSDMTTYDREVIEFLARKENIADALEVYRHVPEVKRKLKSDYWKDCRERLEELLRSERPEGWTIRETGDVETPNSTIQLTQNVLPSGVRCFSFALDVDKDRISVGILFSEQELPWSKEVKDLASELEKDGFKREKQWWVGWVEVENMGDDDFYLRMAENPAKVVQRTVGPLWQLFNKHRSEISKINEGLSSAKS
ncbi:MAG: PD-(D/E)XK nuclease family protein [Burkholderiales bacterium]|nr:PD-(D/E)XK nuclease family protein [Burkholderiales bacterium]